MRTYFTHFTLIDQYIGGKIEQQANEQPAV